MTAPLQQEIHVWLARPEARSLPELTHSYQALLSVEEQQRCQRFHFAHDRKHYLAAHALLRLCLGHYLACAPESVRLTPGLNGKPELAGQSVQTSLHCNLSHTRGMVACAVTGVGPCGIDVEGIRAMADMDGIAQTVYSADEIAYLASQEEAARPLAFFTLWTLKEAYIKATGLGMSAPLQQISIDAEELSVRDASRLAQEPGEWLFDSWQPGPDHALALACNSARTVRTIVYHEMNLATASLHILQQRDIAPLA